MIKKESYYTNDGELVSSRTSHFQGRFHPDRGYALFYNGKTIASRSDVPFPKEVTESDIGKMVLLSKHLKPRDNYLHYKGNKRMKAMQPAHIGKTLGKSESQARRFIKKMTDLGIMAVDKSDKEEHHHYINPLYFLNGRSAHHKLYELFKDELDEHIPKWAIEEYETRTKGGRGGIK